MAATFRSEVAAIQGRLIKDRIVRLPDADPARRSLAAAAAACYLRAADLTDDKAFPLGNAATLRYVEGDRDEAVRLAELAVDAAGREAAADPAGYWAAATAGEAFLVLGRADDARRHYETAVERMFARQDRGALAALLPNLRLLAAARLSFDDGWIATSPVKVSLIALLSGGQ